MKVVTLTKSQAYTVREVVQDPPPAGPMGRQQAYKRSEQDLLDAIFGTIDAALSDYGKARRAEEARFEMASRKARLAQDPIALQRAQDENVLILTSLTEGPGAEIVTIELEGHPFTWLYDNWFARDEWSGRDFARSMRQAIDKAFKDATEKAPVTEVAALPEPTPIR